MKPKSAACDDFCSRTIPTVVKLKVQHVDSQNVWVGGAEQYQIHLQK